jgi:hypothetical protein
MARRVPQLPDTFATTRDALHRLAEQVVSPACVQATGHEIALQVVPGGWGTPPFPGGWVRVSGSELETPAASAPIGSLRAAAEQVGLASAAALDDAPLDVDPDSAHALAAFYGFADGVLRTLRAEAPAELDPSPIRLWPEHFDVAFELGSEAEGRRAGYGASPGDADHREPYLYVAPRARPRGPEELWRARGFTGAELQHAALLAAPDPEAVALTFLRARRDALLA